jgi:hypothetical protein
LCILPHHSYLKISKGWCSVSCKKTSVYFNSVYCGPAINNSVYSETQSYTTHMQVSRLLISAYIQAIIRAIFFLSRTVRLCFQIHKSEYNTTGMSQLKTNINKLLQEPQIQLRLFKPSVSLRSNTNRAAFW